MKTHRWLTMLVGWFAAAAVVTADGGDASAEEEPTESAVEREESDETHRTIQRYPDGEDTDEMPSDEAGEAVDEALARAQDYTDDDSPRLLAGDAVENAYDAAVIRTDIELESEHGDTEGLLDDEAKGSVDEQRMQRLKALFGRFTDGDDAEDSAALARLRETGERLNNSSRLHLQPYVPDPRWEEAMELMVDDECNEALDVATEVLGPPEIHEEGEPAIAYAFARMQMCGDQASRGRQTMRELAELSSPIGELARRRLGRSSSDDIDDGALDLNGHIRRAKQMADDDLDTALEELAEFRGGLDRGWHRHQVRFAEAELLEDAGRVDEAVMAYRGIYRKTAGWRSSGSISSRIEDAEDRLDRTIITFGDRVDRMRALISRGRYQRARAVSRENAQIRGVSGSEVRGWTRYRQALQNERQRRRERAAEQFEEAADLVEDDVILPRLYFGWARALRRTESSGRAIELYDRICDEYPAERLCARSLYEAARLLQYQNDHDEARQRFTQLIGLHPFSDRVPDALWRYSLSAHLQGDYADAIPPLKQIVDHHGELQDASELTIGLKARYWLGTNYLKNGQTENARHWLQHTIDEGPLTWYGLLAIARLEEADLPARVPLPTDQLTREKIEDIATLRIPENPRFAVAAELTRLGIYDDALSEVRSQIDVHPEPQRGTQFRSILHLAVDEPNWTHWIMKSEIDESGPTHRTLRDWGLAFPLNYFELSRKYGEQFGVSPHLVQAIMRQESGFRPTVSSHAGAMGLMQLMPGTARYTARVFFEDRSLSRSQILDEEMNVRLGTMYIRIHEAHAADHTPLALAGYNAGPGALQSWFDRYGDRQLDAFVESITYRETRGYVRKVMTSYITYQGLYGDGELPEVDLDLPDDLGDWGEVPEVDEEEPVSMLMGNPS